jgi:DNA polymerase III subunit delta'
VSETESDREGELPHPRETQELFGHEEAERALARVYAQGRVPPAFLIGGARGLGKATLAYRFARVLLSGRPIDPEAPAPLGPGAGTHAARLLAAQSHPDLLVLRRPYDEKTRKLKSQIPVDDVRKIHSLFGHRAGGLGYRVCIVDTADDLGTAAANALLKTLEEPPASAVFLLIAHAPSRLLPTIRSRCRRLMLKPLEAGAMERFLGAKLPALAPPERRALCELAGGRPGRALTLAEAEGLALYEEVTALLETAPKGDPARLHHFAERLSRPAEEQSYRTAMELLTGFIARAIEARAGLDAPPAEARIGALRVKLLGRGNLEGWAALWEKIHVLVARADALSLDRRQVVLTSFEDVFRLAAGARSWGEAGGI